MGYFLKNLNTNTPMFTPVIDFIFSAMLNNSVVAIVKATM